MLATLAFVNPHREAGWAYERVPATDPRPLPRAGHPLDLAGLGVNPGDVIFADEDGVVVVPQDELEAVIARSHERIAKEDAWLARIAEDDFSPLVDTDEALRAMGCEILD